MSDEFKDAVKPEYISAAFMGALIALSFWPVADRKKACTNIIIGTIISLVSTPGLYSLMIWKFPDFPATQMLLGAVYFWMGLLGMQIVPVVSFLLSKLRDSKLPGGE